MRTANTPPAGLTPSQTVGPFLSIGLTWPDGPDVVPASAPGAIRIGGQVFDGAGAPVTDALVETWQADALGRFAHPDDPRSAAAPSPDGFRGFGRCPTDDQGRWHIVTVKPGPLPGPDGRSEAPHIDVSLFARGLLDRVVTRIYFAEDFADDDGASGPYEDDAVMSALPPERRRTLLAAGRSGSDLTFDIHLQAGPQGSPETVFFDV